MLWASCEFRFVELSDAFSTGSCDYAAEEKPRHGRAWPAASAGRVYGDLHDAADRCSKGLPLAYNKDMQEDKEAVFDSGRHR